MIDVSDGNEVIYYYHFDGLGSVVALSDVNNVVVESYSYDVFGEPDTTSSIGNPYMLTGRQYDSETANYYYRARIYKPSIGRFLQPDPIGYDDGLNMYAYVGNNPVNFLDPFGLASISDRLQGVSAQTSWQEKWWILTNPVRDVEVIATGRGKAISTVIKKYEGHEDGTISNAYLHAYWSAYIAKNGNILLSKEYTDLHESDRNQSFEFGSGARMDIYNNLIGRALATAAFAKDMTVSELLQYALENKLLAASPYDPKLKKFNVDRWFNECK